MIALLLPIGLMLGTSSGQDHVATGTVTGTLIRTGGPLRVVDGVPAPRPPEPIPGRVVAESADGSRHTVCVDSDGHYTISLPPGAYQLTGYSPLMCDGEMQCRAMHEVQVTAGTTTTDVDVICPMK